MNKLMKINSFISLVIICSFLNSTMDNSQLILTSTLGLRFAGADQVTI